MAIKTGPRNLITDVDGIKIGNAHDPRVRTGVTVLIPNEPAVMAGDVRGGGPGTRDTDALNPTCLVDEMHGLFLSGGSEFGLAAGDAVTNWLSTRGKGLVMGASSGADDIPTIPVVPGAILFDLANHGEKSWGMEPPYRNLAIEACESLGYDFGLGNVGAGMGAIAGAYKGGLGSVSAVGDDGLQVGAIVASNPVGSPVITGTDCLWAWTVEQDNEFGGRRPPNNWSGVSMGFPPDTKFGGLFPAANTTIGIVATNAKLTPAQAHRVAIMAQDGLARAIRPIHTPFDGDTIYVVATGKHELGDYTPLEIAQIGTIAADCVARAVARGVYEADTIDDIKCYRDTFDD